MNNDVTPTETQNLSHLSNLPKSVPTSRTISSNPNCNDWLGSKSMNLEARLEVWIVAHCYEKDPRPQRVAELNAIFYGIYTDPRFWKYQNNRNRDYYEDALILMWQYFMRNLCEATTARKSGSFLETRTYAVGRLLNNIEGHLKNIEKRMQEDISLQVQPRINNEGDVVDPVDELPNAEPELALRQFEIFVHLLETDPIGELNAEETALCGKERPYTLTAQTYLLMYHREQKTIHQIAEELHIPRGSLQGGAKPTKWKALARKYAQMAMDSVSA